MRAWVEGRCARPSEVLARDRFCTEISSRRTVGRGVCHEEAALIISP